MDRQLEMSVTSQDIQLATQQEYERQIYLLQQNRGTIRLQSTLLQRWPWDNGIALQHGSMAARLGSPSLVSESNDDIHVLEIILVGEMPLRQVPLC